MGPGGAVGYVGASSMRAWQFEKAQHPPSFGGWTGSVSMQNRYHPAYRVEERDMIPLCWDQRMAVLPSSSLVQVLLAGSNSARRDAGYVAPVVSGLG